VKKRLFLLVPIVGLLALCLLGCEGEKPPTPDELDAMSALQRVFGHVGTDEAGHAIVVEFKGIATVRDADLAPLAKLPYVEMITFEGAPVGDDGIAPLEGMKNLQRLSLRATKITDAGILHLQKCSSLSEIDLERTGITDKGLEALGPIKTLHRVYIGPGGAITNAGIEALKAQNPRVNVSRK
jgi:Leucine Rich repeat